MQAIDLTPVRRQEERFRTAAEEMNQEPTTSEVLEAIDEFKDTSPGADRVRIGYIREATAEIKMNVTQLVQEMCVSSDPLGTVSEDQPNSRIVKSPSSGPESERVPTKQIDS